MGILTCEPSESSSILAASYDAEVDRVPMGRAYASVARPSDIVSEVFHAQLSARNGDGVTLSPAWLMAVAGDKVNDHWRRACRRPGERASHAHAVSDDMTAFPHYWAETLDALWCSKYSTTCPIGTAPCSILHHVDGTPIDDLADLTGKSVRAIELALAPVPRRRFRSRYAPRSSAMSDDQLDRLLELADGPTGVPRARQACASRSDARNGDPDTRRR